MTEFKAYEYKTLVIGGRTVREYRDDLKKAGKNLSQEVEFRLTGIPCLEQQIEITLHAVRPVGRTSKIFRYCDVSDWALQNGFKFCPAETPLALRLALSCKDLEDSSKFGDRLVVPVKNRWDESTYFIVENYVGENLNDIWCGETLPRTVNEGTHLGSFRLFIFTK